MKLSYLILIFLLLISVILISCDKESDDSPINNNGELAGYYFPVIPGSQKLLFGYDNEIEEYVYLEIRDIGKLPYLGDFYHSRLTRKYNQSFTQLLSESIDRIYIDDDQVLVDDITHLLPQNQQDIYGWKPYISFRNLNGSDAGEICDSVFSSQFYDTNSESNARRQSTLKIQLISSDTTIQTANGQYDNCIVLKAVDTQYGNYFTGTIYAFAPGVGIIQRSKTVYNQYLSSFETWDDYQIIEFSLLDNNPPSSPVITSINNNATNISFSPPLSWSCSDPDNDMLLYDCYLSEVTPYQIPLVETSFSDSTYPGSLSLTYNTRYYFQVAAYDLKGGVSLSDIISFVTQQ